jgi:hypothetical protein
MLALWTVCCGAPASASATSPTAVRCGGLDEALDCSHKLAVARASDIGDISDSEIEEPEEELEEGAEEAATAEAEAEEEADSQTGLPSGHADARGATVLSDLQLTARATAALEHHRPLASAIGFSFTLSAPSEMRVTLVEQTEASGHERWNALPDALTINAGPGHVSRSLTGHNRLSSGRYRLTVKPVTSRSRSIYLSVRR